MPEKDEALKTLREQLAAGEARIRTRWKEFVVAQPEHLAEYLREQARLTVVRQEDVAVQLDLPAFKAQMYRTIDEVVAAAGLYFAGVEDERVLNGYSWRTDERAVDAIARPFGEELIEAGFAPGDRDTGRHPGIKPTWYYYIDSEWNDVGWTRGGQGMNIGPLIEKYERACADIGKTRAAIAERERVLNRDAVGRAWDEAS